MVCYLCGYDEELGGHGYLGVMGMWRYCYSPGCGLQ
jgi:hypothetical protein